MMIQTENVLRTATLSMTNPTSTFPVANIVHPFMIKLAKGTIDISTISALWSGDQSMNSLFVGYHNLYSVTIRLYNSASALLATISKTSLELYDVVYFTETYTTVRSMEIDIVSSSEASLGSVSVGEAWKLPNMIAGYTTEHADTSTVEQSTKGQVTQYAGQRLRGFPIALNNISTAERKIFFDTYDFVLKGYPFWIDQYEDILPSEYPPMYCYFTEDPTEVRHQDMFSVTTAVKEAK